MNRSSFLIGSGSILTTAFVDKADWLLRNKNTDVPMIEPEKVAVKIFFIYAGSEYEFGFEIAVAMTKREALNRYCGYDLSSNHLNPLSVLKKIYESYTIRPSDLDEPAYDYFYVES